MTNTNQDITKIAQALAEPFDPFDIEWRPLKSGETGGKKWALVFAYVTNRAIMERLDKVFGVGGWQNKFETQPDGGVLCTIKAKIPIKDGQDYEWVSKQDGADKSDIEPTKGGISNAMKRAGVQWGIGRYLYQLEQTFVTLKEGRGDSEYQLTTYDKKLGGNFHYDRPKMPSWALPKANDE